MTVSGWILQCSADFSYVAKLFLGFFRHADRFFDGACLYAHLSLDAVFEFLADFQLGKPTEAGFSLAFA